MAEGDGSDPINGAQAPAPEAAAGSNPASPVFVSYASQDAAVAAALVEALERHGISCWIAPRDVKAGALYADAIVRAISSAKALVLILSDRAIASSHVGKEIERASSKKRPIIALRIDAAPLTPALEYFLSESQWVEAQSGIVQAAYARLIEAIREPERTAPGIIPGVTPGTSAGTTSAGHPKSRRNRMLFAGGLATLGLAAAALLIDRFWLSKHGGAQRLAMTATGVVSDKSIAVLPFTDMSEKKDQEYFADGMAEEILDLLVRIPGLKVIGRTSSFEFKGHYGDLRTIGAKLGAAFVLEGSVRKSGDRLRVTAQLINTSDGTHSWSETYDREMGDVLKMQDAIAAAVVRELQITVGADGLETRSGLGNPEAYTLYLRGRHAADRWDKDGLDEAITLFKQALDHDAMFADAAAELAYAYESQGEDGFLPPSTAFESARRAAATALRLDPNSARAHFVNGLIHVYYDWDWAAAQRDFQRVATLAPGGADALTGEASLSLAFGRWDDALRQIKAALDQDPLRVPSFYELAETQLRRGHPAEAEAALRRALDIRPTYEWARWLLGLVLLLRGDRPAALLEMQQLTLDDPRQVGLAITYHALGRKADSDAALAVLLKEHADDDAFEIANVYAFRGQPDEATHWLDRAYVQKDAGLLYVKVEMPLKSLEGDARYKAFLRKMNLPE